MQSLSFYFKLKLKQYFLKCEASIILNVWLSILVGNNMGPYINMSPNITFYNKNYKNSDRN